MAKKKTARKRATSSRSSSAKKAEHDGVLRDSRGRLLPGSKCMSPGNPQWSRLAEYRKAVKDAVSPAELKAVMRKLLALAKKGDLGAAKVLLDRATGKVTDAPANPDGAAVDLPTLATTKDTVAATNAILAAMSEGRIDAEAAARYATVVELARRTLETHELAERIAALEAGR